MGGVGRPLRKAGRIKRPSWREGCERSGVPPGMMGRVGRPPRRDGRIGRLTGETGWVGKGMRGLESLPESQEW